ncbi:MAG: peptidoglycan DD-metalloendopeptidase family protein [Bacteroidales bacterium]|nr:peptidoglycan DD-metalloendopeptidase family protein [Bacteroidales bacterium]
MIKDIINSGSILIIIISALLYNSCTESSGNIAVVGSNVANPVEEKAETPEPTLDFYGIDTTAYIRIPGKVKRNQFLSEILYDYGIDYPLINKLIDNSGDIFDVRKIQAGNKYTLYLTPGTEKRLKYMVYEHDNINHYILDFRDEPCVREIERPVKTELRYSSGTIETSLWNTMIDNDLHPMLAIELSEIYAWSIDFFGLQKGDSFKVIYEEEYIDTISNGIKHILAASFSHAGSEIYAIPLIQDGEESYYDLEGNSLRKAFLKAPLRFSRISSRYSNSRLHPILRIRRPHHGVDYAAPAGTPVHAIGDGRVIMREYQGGAGRIVKIRHNSVYTTAYMHLRAYGKGITVGKYVKQGDIIGYVGSTGLSTGPHLDFRFYKNGHAVDPLKVKAPPVLPVSEDNIEKFDKVSSVMYELINSF